MTKVEQARTIKLELAWAAVAWKVDSLNMSPPAMKEQPKTRRRLERIDPSMEVWTIRSSPLTRARIPTMASTASGGGGEGVRFISSETSLIFMSRKTYCRRSE